MIDTRNIMNCSLGSAELILTSYDFSAKPKLKDGVGQVGLDWQIACEGFIDADDAETFYTKLAAIRVAFLTPGKDFIIYGLNGEQELSMLAAACQYGGPYFNVTSDTPDGIMRQSFKFTVSSPVNAATGGGGGNAAPTDSYKSKSSYTPDGLVIVTWSGTLNGPYSTRTFLGTKLPTFQSIYQLPNWIVRYDYESSTDNAQTACNYTLTAQQCANPLPTDSGGAVDGEVSYKRDIDEQGRLTETYDFNCLVLGDPMSFHQSLRATVAGHGTIFRESYSVTSIKGVTVSSSFSVISSGENDGLLSWTQSYKQELPESYYKEIQFPGAAPLAVLEPQTLGKITQSGSATGVETFPYAPDPIGDMLSRPRDISYEDSNAVEKKTMWTYELLATNRDGTAVSIDPTTLARPS